MEHPKDSRVTELCQSAFHAEHQGKFAEAYDLHTQAIQGLRQLADDAGFTNDARKTLARKQIKFHAARKQYIQPLKEGTQNDLPVILPTSVSAKEEMEATRNGTGSISLDELRLSKYLTDKAADPELEPEPKIKHLLQKPVPYYTPSLDQNAPTLTYHIYLSTELITGGHQYYYKVKSDTKDRQTLYVLKARRHQQQLIPNMTLHRSAEFTDTCVEVTTTALQGSSDRIGAQNPRPMQFYTQSSRIIHEVLDRPEQTSWYPRRFTYGGRHFVWEMENRNEWQPQTLYEVEGAWPRPGSKTGGMMHRVVGKKLVWGESKSGFKKVAVIHMAGGMDQMFREYLLASQLARLAVVMRGNYG